MLQAIPASRLPVDQTRRRLDEVPGYFDAEFEVGRLEPNIAREVFREARATTFASPPDIVTIDFLRDHVRFLNQYLNPGTTSDHPARSRSRSMPHRSETRARSAAGDGGKGSRVTQTKKRPA